MPHLACASAARFLASIALAVLAWVPLGAVDVPEITVRRNGEEIADATNTTPSIDTVYGAVVGTPLLITYVIANTGAASLTVESPLTTPITGTNCTATVTTQPAATVLANSTTSVVFSVSCTGTGVWSFPVSFSCNDNASPSENPTNWTVSGTAVGAGFAAPAITVTRGATSITSGVADTLTGTTNGIAESFTYRILNSGSAALEITSIAPSGPAVNCSVNISAAPSSDLQPGERTDVTITLTPSSSSSDWSTLVRISATAPSNFDISLEGRAVFQGPEIEVRRSGGSVVDNGGSVTTSGGMAGSGVQVPFTIANIGTSALSFGLVSFSNHVNCSASMYQDLVGNTMVAPSSQVVGIQVTPASNANWSVLVTLPNTDGNESPTTWTIRGTASGDGDGSDGSAAASSGGCGAGGTLAGLLLTAGMALGLRRRR